MRRKLSVLAVAIVALTSFVQTLAQDISMAEESWETLYAKGKQYRERANTFRALECLEKAEQLYFETNSSDADTLTAEGKTIRRELAQTYFARGKFQKCIDLCRTVLYPDTIDADLYLIARSFEKMERTDSAFLYQFMVAERNIENYNNLVSLAGTLIANEQPEDALTLLNAYCEIDSTNLSVNTVKAYALHQAKRFKEAITEYEKLKAEGDDRCSTNYYLGLSYYRNKNICDAYDLLYRAVEQSNRENTGILSRFGVVELAVGYGNVPLFLDQKHSEGGFREDSYLRTFFENGEIKNRLSIIKEINEQGVADIEEAIEKMQPNKDMLFFLYNNIGNSFANDYPDRAIPYYNKARDIYSDRSNIYYQLAYCYHLKKDYRRELQCYEDYLRYAPKDEDPNTLEYAKECIDECKKVLFMKGN